MRAKALVFLSFAALPAAGAADEVPPPGSLEEGRDLYVTYCGSCHGMEGRGDGTMAAILTILPTDLTRISELEDGVFPYERLARQIDGRDPFLAHGGVMPLYGDFFDGDPPPPSAVIELEDGRRMLTTQPLADLLAYLESIQE
jgi:mono/diheme cytochrome c family protein